MTYKIVVGVDGSPQGDPTEALITASEEADLLVLGSRGRNPTTGWLLGSVCQSCATNTK
jgi:nucleotide-binding universal stress UspA family protein